MLSVETEMNGRSKSTNEKGLSWLFRWTRRTGTRDFYPALAALVSPVHTSFFVTVYYFNLCSPRPAIRAGSRARPPVSECVSPGPIEYEAEGSKGDYVGVL